MLPPHYSTNNPYNTKTSYAQCIACKYEVYFHILSIQRWTCICSLPWPPLGFVCFRFIKSNTNQTPTANSYAHKCPYHRLSSSIGVYVFKQLSRVSQRFASLQESPFHAVSRAWPLCIVSLRSAFCRRLKHRINTKKAVTLCEIQLFYQFCASAPDSVFLVAVSVFRLNTRLMALAAFALVSLKTWA